MDIVLGIDSPPRKIGYLAFYIHQDMHILFRKSDLECNSGHIVLCIYQHTLVLRLLDTLYKSCLKHKLRQFERILVCRSRTWNSSFPNYSSPETHTFLCSRSHTFEILHSIHKLGFVRDQPNECDLLYVCQGSV